VDELTQEQKKKTILAVLGSGTHASLDAALEAAASAIKSTLGLDAKDARQLAEELYDRFLDFMPVGAKSEWQLNVETHAQLKSAANNWVKSEYEAGCKGMGFSAPSIPWFEPATDLEIARIALSDTEYRDHTAAQIRQQIQNWKAQGQSA
jgi:hypothetical protein